ncbi:MAG: cell division protein SepF [Candidatus Micrarchaeia archaeon]
MGLFDKLGKSLGTSKELDIENYMTSDEMADVDIVNEPADFYVKPMDLRQESDLQVIENELSKRNIILLDVSEISKRPNTYKSIVDNLKEYINKTNGDIAMIDSSKILVTPAKVKIIKRKKAASSN